MNFRDRFCASHIHWNLHHTSTTADRCGLKISLIIRILKDSFVIYSSEKVKFEFI
jgi:hypothetical protein